MQAITTNKLILNIQRNNSNARTKLEGHSISPEISLSLSLSHSPTHTYLCKTTTTEHGREFGSQNKTRAATLINKDRSAHPIAHRGQSVSTTIQNTVNIRKI